MAVFRGLSLQRWDVAFAIYVLTNGKSDIAVAYLAHEGLTKDINSREILERRYLEETVEKINAVHSDQEYWIKVRFNAQEWTASYNLHAWVESMNAQLGVAPSYETVFEQYQRYCHHRSDLKFLYRTPENRRKWVRRFMEKWGAARRSIRTQEAEDNRSLRNKVSFFV